MIVAHWLDNVHVLGLLVQTAGAALIGLLCLMLNRVVRQPALRAWSRGWLCLALALVALLIEQSWQASASITLPLYLFGEYLYGFWLVAGCARFADRKPQRDLTPYVLIGSALFAVLLPPLAGNEFAVIFMVQSAILATIFALALHILVPAAMRTPKSPGLIAMRVALTLLIINFVYYVPIFGAHALLGEPLPMTLLKLSSAAHLVFEFVLGFGGAVLILEHSHRRVLAQNQRLRRDNLRFRVEAEQDALTGAYNRRAFFRLLDTLRRHGASAGCVAVLDMDDMKRLNDNHGHAMGDAALVQLAQAARQLVRGEDFLFRWGGDEFLLLTLGLGVDEFSARLATLNPHLLVGSLPVRVSYGVAEFSEANDILAAVQRADAAMYANKRAEAVRRRRAGFSVVNLPDKTH